jgi:hypothetical protein
MNTGLPEGMGVGSGVQWQRADRVPLPMKMGCDTYVEPAEYSALAMSPATAVSVTPSAIALTPASMACEGAKRTQKEERARRARGLALEAGLVRVMG